MAANLLDDICYFGIAGRLRKMSAPRMTRSLIPSL